MIFVAVSFCSVLLILIDFNKSVCSAVNNNQNTNYVVKNGRRHQLVTTRNFLAVNAPPNFSTTHCCERNTNIVSRRKKVDLECTSFVNLNQRCHRNRRRCDSYNYNTFTIGSATKTLLRIENDLRQQFRANNVRCVNRKLKNQYYDDDDSVEYRSINEARVQRERNLYQQDAQREQRQRIPKDVVEEYEDDLQQNEEDEETYYRGKSRATSPATKESASTINDSSSQNSLRRRQRRKSTRMIECDENDDNDTGFANYYGNARKNRGEIGSEYLDDNLEEEYYFDEEYPDNSDGSEYYDSNTKRPEMVWEQCATPDNAGTASVLLPPSDVDRPSCVIHFIGGTLFGSAPTIWYKNLLEDIVQNTNAVVIATSIPITVFSSPLQHIELAKRCYKQFNTAYRTIVLDEYCYGGLVTEEQFALDVPICGIGHSLGARLLTVLTTLKPEPVPDSAVQANGLTTPATPIDEETTPTSREVNRRKRQRKRQQQQLSYKTFILISFTNYGAASGIPGIYQLSKQSEKLKNEQALADSIVTGQEKQRQRELKLRTRRRLRNKERLQQPYNSFDDNDLDDDYDDDLYSTSSPLVTDLFDRIRTSTLGIKSLLTPEPGALEFYPTPNQLWKAILDDKRYRVPKTLLVQFDNDQIDQSAKLATTLLLLKDGVNQVEKDDKQLDINPDRSDDDNFPWLDIRFARLRGDHLTPVSIGGNDASITSEKGSTTKASSSLPPQIAAINQVFRAALLLSSSATSKGNFNSKKLKNERRSQFDELRQSIIRYINDVATKVDD